MSGVGSWLVRPETTFQKKATPERLCGGMLACLLTVSTLKVEKVVSAPQKPVPAMSFRRGSRLELTLRAPSTKLPAMLTACVYVWSVGGSSSWGVCMYACMCVDIQRTCGDGPGLHAVPVEIVDVCVRVFRYI